MTHATERILRGDRVHARTAKGPIIAAVGPTGGDAALRMTLALAARHANDVLVVSAVHSPPAYAVDADQPMLDTWPVELLRTERLKQVHNQLHRLGGWLASGEEPAVEIPCGDASSSIADIADERDAALIVMGAGPHELSNRLFATETALATMRKVHCPVLAVSEKAQGLPRVVVIATDFSPASVHAAMQALPLVADGANIQLVHVWSRIRTPYHLSALRDLDDTYERSLPARFERLRTALGRAHPRMITTVVREGPAAQTVLEVAREVSADLIVAGTRGFGMLERMLIGSVSTALLRGSECSVLIVPGPDAAERTRLQRHMTGTSTVRAPEEWAEELEAFARRNQHRRTSLEIDDRSIGAQVQESGYTLMGATYDPHDRCIELMFEWPNRVCDHLTRSIGNVRNVAVTTNTDQRDGALCIEAQQGSALLTFLRSR
jgi:nucleotide-binding universal stress UspA family protein